MEIQITRPKQYQDKIRNYQVLVDGEELIKLKPNSTVNVTLPENAECIQATIDWCSSAKFNVKDIKSNQLVIKNTFGGNLFTAIFMPLYYITFGKNKYLTIESGNE